MDINAVIAAGVTAPVADAQPNADATQVEEINEIIEPSEADPAEQAPVDNAKDEPWPKKAENALAKAKGKAAQLRAERDQERAARQRLEQQLAQYNSPPKQPEKKGEPNVSNYENTLDYMRDMAKYDHQQEMAARDEKQKETQQSAQEAAWIAEREDSAAAKAQELMKEIPELPDFVEEYEEIYDAFPAHIKRAFLEADNPLLAAFNLAKEGKFEGLASMSLARAAMEIGRATSQAPKPKPVTNAPTPMAPARGTATSKGLADIPMEQLLKQFNTR